MTAWHEYFQKNGFVPVWPYPIKYGEQNDVVCDVLVVGGGIAGCHAAISAAKKGAKVVVLEKGAAKRSGSGGTGVDHWHAACTNPCSRVTPEAYTRAIMGSAGGYACGPARYIDAKESWDTLLDCEGMGVQIRDVKDEFKGADFRDNRTKLMFAYDYENRHVVRVWAYNIKPALYHEMRRVGVTILDRTMATSLLTEGGRQGARVVGATGVNVRTGAFSVVRSKATVVCTGTAIRLWVFAPEMTTGAMRDSNNAGVGQAIGWNAGAEFVEMEHCRPAISGLGYAPYSMGNTSNTYHGTPIVDAAGIEVPWFDIHGKEVRTERERFRPAAGQPFMLGIGIGLYSYLKDFRLNDLTPDLPDRIKSGEFTLPLYADLTRLSAEERRCIFGMMVGNEGKTRIPVYDTLTKAGFDPDKDLLQAPVMIPEGYQNTNYWSGTPYPNMSGLAGGGFLVDWDLRTSLEGLYAAGLCVFGCGAHASAAVSGRYTGRKAAEYAKTARQPGADRTQMEREKTRVYAPVRQARNGVGWKETQLRHFPHHAGLLRQVQERPHPEAGSPAARRAKEK